MDVTLNDLMIMEPRLVALAEKTLADQERTWRDEAVVSWAVTTRMTPPHLPALRGGELILVPSRVAEELTEGIPALLREAKLLGASGVVLPLGIRLCQSLDQSNHLPVLQWHGEFTPDTETYINRELTECRGNLYRVGSELERRMADVAVASAGVTALVRVVAVATDLPIRVVDGGGRVLAAMPEAAIDQPSWSPSSEIRHRLYGDAELVLGPLRDEQRVVARFLAPRIATAVESALRRDDAARPRGRQRIEATESLLAGHRPSASDQRAAALALGFDPDATFFVAVTHGGAEAALTRALAPLGGVHPAGGSNGRHAALVAVNERTSSELRAGRVAEIKRQWERDHAEDGATLALSAPALGVSSLPGAAREANFVASLQEQSQFPRLAASFESVDDIGALRLLYQLRDSTELRQFVTQALGSLENRDQRGTLRETLRAFLESGGSQVDASHRLGIHRNTLAYRLRRIGELVGRDIGDPASWLTLHLALSASEMLDACRDDR